MWAPYFLTLATATALLSSANGLGINCRGSSVCGRAKTNGAIHQLAIVIRDGFKNSQSCRYYKNGEHIACIPDGNIAASNGGFCAFLQNTGNGASSEAVATLIRELASRTDDKCNNCGSIPYSYPPEHGGKNDAAAGLLTVNFVHNRDNPCSGFC